MARSRIFDGLSRIARIAHLGETQRVSSEEATERLEERTQGQRSRREFLAGLGTVAASAALGAAACRGQEGRSASSSSAAAVQAPGSARVAIVGGGLAGLVCADRLRAKGVVATLYEGNDRVGGRCHSNTTTFPGQVAELGGELIDNLHKTMLAYANEFGLLREDVGKAPGESFYYFNGQRYAESAVVAEYRTLVARMRPDLQHVGSPTFFSHNEQESWLDQQDLASYLYSRGADLPLARAAIEQAYIAEYGRELSEQSALNFLLFIHLDRRSKFTPYGVFSDERFHIVGGNDQIAKRIAARLPGPIEFGARLTRLDRGLGGQYELYFNNGTTPSLADAVVLAVPFSTLRSVTLGTGLGLSADKRRAITDLGYGYNAKTMIGFDGRPWAAHGSNGSVYSDLANVQNTWETNWSRAGATSILTDYSGATRGKLLQDLGKTTSYCGDCHTGPTGARVIHDEVIQAQTAAFLTDLERVYPGAKAAASRLGDGRYRVLRGHWLPQRFSRGSYTCYGPGQFTGIAGLEGQSAGALKFAGEHADSFYSSQGFLEGACLSGLAAANELLDDLKHGRI